MRLGKMFAAFVLALVLIASPRSASAQAHVTKEPKARDGTPVALDLPRPLQLENTGGSDGAGLCVFTSIARAALWQNVAVLQMFRDFMQSFPGGGYPEKVVDFVKRICKSRGESVPDFIQYQGRQLELIKLAVRTGRMPCVTYGKSPTFRYNGRKIYHMVNVVAAGEGKGPDGRGWWCVADNNYPGTYEWMSEQQFATAFTYTGNGWAFFLLAPCPPPVPKKGSEMNTAYFPLVLAFALGQCENGSCQVPAAGVVVQQIGERQGPHQWGQVAGEKAARLYRNNVLVGQFDYITGTYHEWNGKEYGEAALPPVPSPVSKPGICPDDGGPCNFGVLMDQSNRSQGVFLNGHEISTEKAKKLFNDGDPEISDDTEKKHLSIIVKGEEKRKLFEGWAKREAEAKRTAAYRVQIYDADTLASGEILSPFALERDKDFAAKGSVAIVQAPGTTHAAPILARVYGFQNTQDLRKDLRKVDPNFDPILPIPVPNVPPATPEPGRSPPWLLWSVVGLVVVVGAIVSTTSKQTK